MKPTRDNIIELSLTFSNQSSELITEAREWVRRGNLIEAGGLRYEAYKYSTAAHDLLTAALRLDGAIK